MAGTTVTPRKEFPTDSQVDAIMQAVNTLIAEMDTLAAKLNADAGVTDTNYAASAAAPLAVHD